MWLEMIPLQKEIPMTLLDWMLIPSAAACVVLIVSLVVQSLRHEW